MIVSPPTELTSSHTIVVPCSIELYIDSLPVQDLYHIQSVSFSPDDQLSPWMSVDGEKYDSRPVTVQWMPGRLLMFCASDVLTKAEV